MAKKPAIHTVPKANGWANRTEGASRTFGGAPTKAKAEAKGRASAKSRGVEQISHRKNGTIGERRSYCPDPHPPKG